eukprot:jgi/Bigna1/146991/aug1.126_g21699
MFTPVREQNIQQRISGGSLQCLSTVKGKLGNIQNPRVSTGESHQMYQHKYDGDNADDDSGRPELVLQGNPEKAKVLAEALWLQWKV